ncbi:hypothetical protein [Cohnella yongneupensis]|uniref:Tetratricopeptide repeat protein n=1 Tax=Cohnella yongneupensis TaxID=425006 RepID=A0ABW0QZS1_9BACL
MAGDNAFKVRLDAAISRHNKGMQGDRTAVKDAFAQLSELRAIDSNHALLEAYYGSTLTLMARDADKLLDKADKSQQGLASLDRAISLAPGNAVIRLIRANVCLRLPENFFGRTQTAIDDFNDLLARHQRQPDLLTPIQYKQVIQGLATAYENTGKLTEARTTRQRLTQPPDDAIQRGKGASKDGKKPKVRKSK